MDRRRHWSRRYDWPERAEDPWKALPREEFEEVVLDPGDLLMLPAGTWHEAEAEEGESLALNLAFEAFSLLALVRETLAARVARRPRWRGWALPPRQADLIVRPDAAEGWPEVPEMLDELAAELRALAADPEDLWTTWARLTTTQRPAMVGDRARPRKRGGQLSLETILSLVEAQPPQFLLTRSLGGCERLTITLPSAGTDASACELIEIEDAASLAWVCELLRRRRFSLKNAIEWGALYS